MNEILRKIIEKCSLMAQSSNLLKIVWNMSDINQGCYTKGFNQKNDEVEFNITYSNGNTELVTNFFAYVNEIEPKINKGTLTIYPNGEYESSFIWDEQAHLDYLIRDASALFSFVYNEICYKISDALLPDAVIHWNEVVMEIPFKEGQVQPISIEIKTGKETIHHSILIQNLTNEESPWLIGQFADFYQLTNEGKLKGKLSERKWNTLVISFDTITGFNWEQPFDKGVSFEWREDLA